MNQNVEAGFIQVLKRVNFFNIFSFCICFYLYSKLCNFNKNTTSKALWSARTFSLERCQFILFSAAKKLKTEKIKPLT